MTTACQNPIAQSSRGLVRDCVSPRGLAMSQSPSEFLIAEKEAADEKSTFRDMTAFRSAHKSGLPREERTLRRQSMPVPAPVFRKAQHVPSDHTKLEEDGMDDDELMRKWTLSPMSSVQSSNIAEIPFISPQSTINFKRTSPGSALSEIRVESGLIGMLPDQLRLSPYQMPCAVFALICLQTGKPRWLFVKEYEQLANFNDLIQSLLAPLFRQTGFRLREFPSRDLFQSTIPWKVDIRNDMLNAYFKSLFWLYDMDVYVNDPALQESVERAINALWQYDKVEPSPTRSFGLYGEEMCGFLLSRSRTSRLVEWDCYYYAMNGSFLDIVDNLATGHIHDSICLFEARIEKYIVLYLAKADNERYAINIYETTAHGNKRIHTVCAENEVAREKWLYHLRQRVSHLTLEDIAQGARSKTRTPPLPYVLPKSSHPSPFLPEHWDERVRSRKGTQRLMASLAEDVPNTSMMPFLFRPVENPVERVGENDQSYFSDSSSPGKSSICEISSPIATLTLSRDAVLAEMIASDAQDAISNAAPLGNYGNATAHSGEMPNSDLHRSSSRKSICPGMNKTSKGQNRGVGLVFGVMPKDCKQLVTLPNGERVPSVVARCLELLSRRKATEEMGLFRISGTQKKLDELQGLFDQTGDYDMIKAKVDVHTTADLLKRYLRALPDRLLVEYSEARTQQLLTMDDRELQETMRADLSRVDRASTAVAKAVLKLLFMVSRKESKNAMGLRNLGVAMSPGLRLPIPILEFYIQHHETIFECRKSFACKEGVLSNSPYESQQD